MKFLFRTIELTLIMITAVFLTVGPTSAWAVGSNTTSSASTPVTPTPVSTGLPQLSTVGSGGCAQQYTDAINAQSLGALVANDVGLGANAVGATAAAVGVGANLTAAIADEVAQAAITAAWGVGAAAQVTGATALVAGAAAMATAVTVVATPASVVGGGIGMAASGVATGATGLAMGVAATATGVQAVATGAKIVALGAEAVGVAATITGVGSQIAAQVFSHQEYDLAAYAATLPNCNAEFTGTVEVSGGGVAVTGDSVFNDDVGVAADVNVAGDINSSQVHTTQGISAVGGGIWLGDPNGTTFSDGITIGGGAVSGAGMGGVQAFTGDVDAIAIGNNAQALMAGSLAFGLNSAATSTDSIAIGTSSVASGEQDVVIGTLNNTDSGGNNTVVGNEITIIGAASTDNTVLGVGHQVTGSGNFVAGDPNTIIGSLNVATGVDSSVAGDSNIAIGDTVNIAADRAIAVGNNTTANADDTMAIGTNAQANAAGSAAFGQGAVANQTQQQVFGTQENTYTTPGITSGLSRSRQTGPIEVATSDIDGNLATDGGQIFEALSDNQAGVAIAMALQVPSLHAGESFGVALSWGMFNKSQALGLSAMGVAARDVFKKGDRIALTGGFGVSIKEESFGGRRTHSSAGGRVGAQLSW
ncbi:MAG: hypothetical protein J7K90_05035 [Desulfuromusa sp.]|nr:hypothetical protein [Desulfuromusa sp.]